MENLFDGVFKGKNVLITGHTGFKGSWLSLWLKELNANVVGYALKPPTEPNLFEILNLEREIISVIGDIRDLNNLNDTFQKYRPDFIFHLAAQSILRESYDIPKYTYETNVMGTLNVFEAVRNTDSVRVVVNVTSDKCYDNKEWVWGYRETDAMGGFDPYSSSKGCAELLTNAYRHSYFKNQISGENKQVSLATVRAGNVIGGGDWAKDRLIPDCIRALSKGETIKIRNPQAIRPWQHVLEPLRGYLSLAVMMFKSGNRYAEAWNFGPTEEDSITVKEMVNKVVELWGKGEWEDISQKISDPLHEAKYLRLDCSKARRILDWRPMIDIDKAINFTIDWYRAYYDKSEDINEYTKNQINKYLEELKGD
ncbi:CDP-glucose 4,6-dehydratase [candidate division WOR-3 bacterium]|nr:CDP-glucose 4,6-dehydratase [candidate division WOR-3 bacterium]